MTLPKLTTYIKLLSVLLCVCFVTDAAADEVSELQLQDTSFLSLLLSVLTNILNAVDIQKIVSITLKLFRDICNAIQSFTSPGLVQRRAGGSGGEGHDSEVYASNLLPNNIVAYHSEKLSSITQKLIKEICETIQRLTKQSRPPRRVEDQNEGGGKNDERVSNSLPFHNIFSFASQNTFSFLMNMLIQGADLLVQSILPPPGVPDLRQDVWWGEGRPHHQDATIRPYHIKFNIQKIKSLLYKLKYRENLTSPLDGAAMTYGTNTDFLHHVLDYWQNHYDFEARQNWLNKYPQFMTNVQGLDIHFMHIKPRKQHKKVVPLLLLHGWPVSSAEYLYVIEELTRPRQKFDFIFEVIAPTIPGFGYSQGTSKIGLTPYHIGIIFKNLMKRLGFDSFYIHGGDVGQYIAADMITMYPDQILGLHTNFPYSLLPRTLVKYALGSIYPPAVVSPRYAERMYPISNRLYFIITKFGYFHIQATHPDGIGVSLIDSPSGLASWLLNTIAWASNPNNVFFRDGRLLQTYSIDDLLDVITVMWDSASITTSMRLYAESTGFFQDPNTWKILFTPTPVPYAAIKFQHEIIYQPDEFLKDKYTNLVHSTTLDFGGHFAAYEYPNILADDIWASLDKMRDYHKHTERGNTFQT